MRLIAATVAAGCLAVLITAAVIEPNRTGLGTHARLGLQSCQFEKQTGLPCPSCGMTTSFAWFARGNLRASLYVQPMGTVLAILTGFTFWIAIYLAITGRSAHRLLRFIPARYYLMPLLAMGLIAWAWKIFIHLRGIDGW